MKIDSRTRDRRPLFRRSWKLSLCAPLLLMCSMVIAIPVSAQIGEDWTRATHAAPWEGRGAHTSVTHDGKMWVIGGGTSDESKNDVWQSSDGAIWVPATLSAEWSPRLAHTSVVFDNKMWVIGGFIERDVTNDVWYSADGERWTSATLSAPWAGRFGHTSVVFDGRIWVIGGSTRGGTSPEVWASADGTSWELVVDTPEWANSDVLEFKPEAAGRSWHTSVVHDGRIWLIGGFQGVEPGDWVVYVNDVWYSVDGRSWTAANTAAPWAERTRHTSIVYDGRMWVLGRRGVPTINIVPTPPRRSDVWFSPDGATWSEATSMAAWSPRGFHSSVVFDDKIWVLGGSDDDGLNNDVWYSGPPVNGAMHWMRYP